MNAQQDGPATLGGVNGTVETITGYDGDGAPAERSASRSDHAGRRAGSMVIFEWLRAVLDTDPAVLAADQISGVMVSRVGCRAGLYGDADGQNIRPGVQRLATDLHMSERTVRRALAVLVERGWLNVVSSGQGGRRDRRATTYRAVLPKRTSGGPVGLPSKRTSDGPVGSPSKRTPEGPVGEGATGRATTGQPDVPRQINRKPEGPRTGSETGSKSLVGESPSVEGPRDEEGKNEDPSVTDAGDHLVTAELDTFTADGSTSDAGAREAGLSPDAGVVLRSLRFNADNPYPTGPPDLLAAIVGGGVPRARDRQRVGVALDELADAGLIRRGDEGLELVPLREEAG